MCPLASSIFDNGPWPPLPLPKRRSVVNSFSETGSLPSVGAGVLSVQRFYKEKLFWLRSSHLTCSAAHAVATVSVTAIATQEELSNDAFSCCVLLKYERHTDRPKASSPGKASIMAKNGEKSLRNFRFHYCYINLHSCWLLKIQTTSITFRGPLFMLWVYREWGASSPVIEVTDEGQNR